MGVGNSIAVKKKKDASAKYYRPPDVRQKDRYEPEETSIFSNQNDSSIDKVREELCCFHVDYEIPYLQVTHGDLSRTLYEVVHQSDLQYYY